MKKKANKEQDVLEYMRSISNIPRYEPMKTTLIEWCEYWLSTRANNLKDSTRSSYEYVINNHFKRVFKDMRLEDLTADDVQLFINSLIIGYQIPEPLNAKTIKNIHGVLHKALSVAVTQGCVPFNAAQGTVLPNIERTPPTPLTDAQIIKFFERIKYHEKRDIFVFALLTGLRESEIIGLTVNCFDKEEHPNKYGLGGTAPNAITVQGQTNGDVDIASKGLTSNDALLIQEFLLHRVNTLEPSKS